MKVKDIQIDGFGVWTGLSVDSLPEGMTLFYGPNEAGKTTLMQFLRAMLYGFTESRRDKYLPPVHGGTPGGAIRVTGPGGGYHIRRTSQLTDTNTIGQLTVTGQDGLTQGQHRLSSLLGQIDEPIFTNVFAIGIRELQELSTLDGTAAADELYKLSSGLDRVSLVDVLRSLRRGRENMIGNDGGIDDDESTKLAAMIRRREKLRDEVNQLTRHGRRWSELASQRRSQQQEIEQLSQRMGAWERESRSVEIATSVYDTWSEREKLVKRIAETEKQAVLPDEAPGQLVQIDAMIEDSKNKLEEVKQRRRDIRVKADQLPVSKRMVDLQGRIEAASEQATWIEALEEQIDRIDGQIEKAKKQLDMDADRLGMDDDDRLALAEGDMSRLPDLSKQTLSALSGPAKRVREQVFLLKQARSESAEHKERAEKMRGRLREVLDRAHASDLQHAIREETELVSALKHRGQLGEHLEKLKRHYRDLEKESVELTTDEALPIDRFFLLSVPFVFGAFTLIHGISHLLGITVFVAEPEPTWGLLCLLGGMMSMMIFYYGYQNGLRTTSRDLDDCERQIDTLRKQIRELEAERNDTDSTLPTSSDSIDMRIRESQELLSELEASLPNYHNHEAAMQSYKTARARASTAAEGLKDARHEWAATLERLGLSETLSPTSVRKLSDGYETLQASRRRLEDLRLEREQRRRERKTIAQRVEALYFEAMDLQEEQIKLTRSHENEYEDFDEADGEEASETRSYALERSSKLSPLEQLNELHEQLSRQQHWIKRRRELKEQDVKLKRQQSTYTRGIERGEQQRRALWAKCGVATPEQFYELVDSKASLSEMRKMQKELDKQVRSIIGNHIEYDDVAREINGAKMSDLERRWDSLTTRMTETEERIAQLRTQQGQLAQEMKQLGEDNRLTTAQLELGCIERKIASATQRWQTLAMASNLLEDVCGTFERERQPETLREASSFLNQLTDGKYTRIWTPLGTNQLKIDDHEDKSLPLEVLSRGTREAVFIALRLSLAAAYSRRGVMLPLILDDVLVNFDRDRAMHAARTLKTFSELGHQVMMFTCHEHIVDIFQDIDVEVRMMPEQGVPGRAEILLPEETEYEEEEVVEEEDVEEEAIMEHEPEPEPVMIQPPEPEPKPTPKIVYVERKIPRPQPRDPEPKPEPAQRPKKVKPNPEPVYKEPSYSERRYEEPEYVEEVVEYVDPEPSIEWAWFEREPARRVLGGEEARVLGGEEAMAAIAQTEWIENDSISNGEAVPDEVWNATSPWWNGRSE